MAINSIGVTLKWGTTPITAKVVDIKDYPDLGGTSDLLETTTQTDRSSTGVLGLPNQPMLEFTCNYTKADFLTVQALKRQHLYYAMAIGNVEGSEGTFTWEGQHDCQMISKGVNEVPEMKVYVSAITDLFLAHVLTNVVLGGSPKVGVATAALTKTYLPVSPTPTPTLAYQWKICATVSGTYVDISGATSATYTPITGDATKYIKCQVTAGGSAVGTFTSNALQVAA